MSAIPAYEELLALDKYSLWPVFTKLDYPPDHIPRDTIRLYKGGLVAILASDCTYVRLPDNHPWYSLDPMTIAEAGGYPTNTIGVAMKICHFHLDNLTLNLASWLVKQFTLDQAKQIFDDDIYAAKGFRTSKRWLCITYENLNHPCWALSPIVKLPKEYRRRDAHNAVAAILAAAMPKPRYAEQVWQIADVRHN